MIRTAQLWFTPPREQDRFLPEGPRVLPTRELIWVNIQTAPDATAGQLHTLRPDFRHARIIPLPARPGFVFPTTDPNIVLLGLEKEVGILDLNSEAWIPLATIPDSDPRTIINDGEIVPGGTAVIFGTKDTRFADALGHLYLLTLNDKQLSVLADGMTCSNGKVFANSGHTLYDIDTPRKVVTEYDFDLTARRLTEKGIALDLRHRHDFPDGMIDSGDGTVIIAFYNPHFAEAGRALQFRLHTGEVLNEWLTPGSPRVTCPLLFSHGGTTKLLLTTANEGMTPNLRSTCPNAGCLFLADTDFPPPAVQTVVKLK